MKSKFLLILFGLLVLPELAFGAMTPIISDTTEVSNTAYDTTSWDGVTTIAPTKNAVRDYFYLILGGMPFLDQNAAPDAAGELLYDNTVAGIDDGAFCWYDDDEVRYLVDIDTLPSDDGYVVTYDSATQRFVMEVGGNASVSGNDTEVQFNDGGTMGADAGLTYNKTTNVLTAAGGFVCGASAAPLSTMDDSDTAAETTDYSLGVNATDTGDGTEDVDITEKTMIAGTLTTIRLVNADGNYEIGTATMPTEIKGELQLKTIADPDSTVAGQMACDSDGANITGDVSIRMGDGTNQFLVARKLKTFTATIVKPQDMADAVRDACYIWENRTGMTFTITEISCTSGTDDTTLNVEEVDADGQNNATVDAVEIATNGTGIFTQTETTITGATIEAGHKILIDFDDTDDPSFVMISISGWFDVNVD